MTKTRQWTTFTAIAVVVVLAAGWFLLVSKQNSKAADLRSQAVAMQGTNATLATQVAQLQQQKKGLPAQQRLLAKYGTQIPDNPELPALIRELTIASNAAGVDLVSLAPVAPTPVTPTTTGATGTTPAAAASGATAPTAARVAPAAALDQITLTVMVKGSFYNIESFFANVEQLSRAMKVTGFTMAPASSNGSASSAPSTPGSTAGAPQDPPGTLVGTLTSQVFESPQIVSPSTSLTASAK